MTSALRGMRPTEIIQRVGDNVLTEADTGMIQSQVKEHQQPPKAGGSKEQNLP